MKKSYSFYFVSLGCSKNLVDSQVMIGMMQEDEIKLVQDPQLADIIVVNTCSFIDLAKEESVNTILEMADFKNKELGQCKALVVSGCLVQRYHLELEKELPEVDMFIGTGQYHKVVEYLKQWEEGVLQQKSFVDDPRFIHDEWMPRAQTTPFYSSWLKVSEGCNRKCTFCIIPKLRGALRSRTVESLVTEVKNLAKSGTKEINLISQDLSDYGSDLNYENPLLELFSALDSIEEIEWIRLFYLYPDDLNEDVINFLGKAKKIVPYIDMPVQHFSDSVLKRMNRKITGDQIVSKIQKLRNTIPNIVLRSSVIVGFPGEDEKDFHTLKEGLKAIKFDHLGVFRYSDEEGTPAYKLTPKVDPKIIRSRFQEIYDLQKEIVNSSNQKYLGKTIKVLIEGKSEETDLLLQGRHYGQAPDIDGHVLINDGWAHPGDIVDVEITEILDYDLLGHIKK